MFLQKSDEWCLCVEAESVVAEVDRVQVLWREQGCEEGVEGRGDFGEEAGGEYVGEVGTFEGGEGGEVGSEGSGSVDAYSVTEQAELGDDGGVGCEGGYVRVDIGRGVEF